MSEIEYTNRMFKYSEATYIFKCTGKFKRSPTSPCTEPHGRFGIDMMSTLKMEAMMRDGGGE